jgi:hypothetical protein
VTETCDSGKLNLIVDVQTEAASMADNHYLPSAVDAAGEIVPDTIERAHTDGAYNSRENREHCAGKGMDLVSGGMQGKPSKYDLEKDGQGKLKVTNKETGEDIPAVAVKPKKPDAPETWRIKDGGHRAVYFTEEDVETSLARKRVETLPKEVKNIRNNVEATIFQLGYHCRADKSRYRGLAKHKMWAISRCLWVNFRRIAAWVGGRNEELADTLLLILRFLPGASLSAV